MERGLFSDNGNGTIPPSFPPAGNPFFNGLDASSSKQLALLNATAQARAAQAGQTSDGASHPNQQQYSFPSAAHQQSSSPSSLASPFNMQQSSMPGLGPTVPQQMSAPANPAAARQNPSTQQQLVFMQRRISFLQNLSKVHAAQHTPLPASISGSEPPPDPNAVFPSPWRDLEPASQPGGVKVAGRDVDLFKFWSLVHSVGGGANKVQQQGAWANFLPVFGLPEQLPQPQGNGTTSTAMALAGLYMKLLSPFDETYYKQMSDVQRNVLAQQGRLPHPQSNPFPGGGHNTSPPTSSGAQSQQPHAQSLSQIPPQQGQPQSQTAPALNVEQAPAPGSANELDAEARKRKTETGEDINMKRRRTNSGSPEHSRASEHNPQTQMSAPPPAPSTSGRVKARRKIEYVPFSREVETAGGRDVNQIQAELLRMSRGHHLRDINDWGRVYVDALTMSLRSRLSVELSYALSTLTLVSTMRSQGHDTGMAIGHCPELLEELLDLFEELAFPKGLDGAADVIEDEVVTNRQLIQLAQEELANPLASQTRRQGDFDPSTPGPTQRRADLIRLVLNLFRNLSAITENQQVLANSPLLIDLLLATTSLDRSNSISNSRPLSDALSLPDLIAVRKEVVSIFVNLCGLVPLSSSKHSVRAKRVFALVSSYLVDPAETVPPFQWVMQNSTGAPGMPIRAPLLPDEALEVFTRISQPDGNRKVIGTSVPRAWLWQLIESLVYRLPSRDQDFNLLARDESWLGYLEKLVLALYSLAYLMPPDLKQRVKKDRSLCFAKVMLRFVKCFIKQRELIGHTTYCTRRAIETLKIIDDGDDALQSVQPSAPPLSFGVGYGEHGDKRVEIGHGLLGGQQEDVLWSIMLQRDMDEIMFSELESLARVEISAH